MLSSFGKLNGITFIRGFDNEDLVG